MLVPVVVVVSAMLGAVALHIVWVDGVAVIAGEGFTVITTVFDAVQLLAVPVTV